MNPYRDDMLLEGMLASAGRFIGLSDEIELLMAHVTQDRPASVSLVGPRGMGKSFTLRFLADPLGARQRFREMIGPRFRDDPRRLLFVPLDLSDAPAPGGRLPLLQLMRDELHARLATLLDLVDTRLLPVARLAARRHASLDTLRQEVRAGLAAAREELTDDELREQFDQAVGVRLPDALAELLRRLEGLGVRTIFLLDEFDQAVRALGQEDYDQLRAVQSAASLVVASTRALSEQVPVEVQTSPFFNLLHRLTLLSLHFLPPDDARRLIAEPPAWHAASECFRFSEGDVAFILELTGLHPDLILATCEYLYRTRHRAAVPGENLLPAAERPVIRALLRPVFADLFARLWREVSDRDRPTLVAIAAGRQPESVPPELLARGYVVYEEGRFRLFAGLFSDYVRDQAGAPAAPREGPQLTDLEQRLLELLRAHPGELVARDTIVVELYGPAANAAEARGKLDALVSRLRAKLIGGPHGLESVRGQGYRLVRRDT